MKINDIIDGFKVVRARESCELSGVLWEMVHEKTGAELCWVDNGCANKLFSIAFKTVPSDDTGVFHILEHSVLCGSDRYPVKEPFLDLLKSSMNTFLNAMTFPDKTMYPVSSRNDRDFLNLTGVYLDAVFAPAIYKNENIFRQEGWHYELHDGDAAPTYKGVVFNEMKGAFSSVDTQLYNAICRALFPDNCYGFVSGGDPEAIPDLTYEQFLSQHAEYYHPSNSKIFLDGAVPLDAVLSMIDSYLCAFERSDKQHDIPVQRPVASTLTVKDYEIGADEDPADKTQFAFAKLVGDYSDRKKIMAVWMLSSYLTGSNESPLKRAILARSLAQDVTFTVEDGILQPFFVMQFCNTEPDRADEIRRVVREVCGELAEKGLDRDELSAIINQFEFSIKETEEPQGLSRNINALSSWLYGGDPMIYLESERLVGELRAELDGSYFENLLRVTAVDDRDRVEVILKPSKTRGDELRAAEAKRLETAAAAWDESDRARIIAENAELDAWQVGEDSPEAKATLPSLSIGDVDPEPEKIESVVSEYKGVKYVYHPVKSNGIVHGNLYFSVNDLSLDAVPMLSLMSDLLGELPTSKHTVLELQREIKRNIGAINYDVVTNAVKGDPSSCRVYFTVSFSALKARVPQAIDLICEILRETSFADSAAVREILLQVDEDVYQSFLTQGHRFAMRRALVPFNAASAVQEASGGYDFFRRVRDFKNNFDEKFGAFRDFAENAKNGIFNSARLTVTRTADDDGGDFAAFADRLELDGAAAAPDTMKLELSSKPVKEAIIIPAGVSYAAAGGHVSRCGAEFEGGLNVLSSILTYGYLWTEIRVRRGAYGCGFRAGERGSVFYYSYRDPSPLASLGVYADTPEFIRRFVESGEPLDNYIISSVAATEPLMSPARLGLAADRDLLSGVTFEDRRRIRREMLGFTPERMSACADMFDKLRGDLSVCVVGNGAALADTGDDWIRYTL